MRTYKRKELGGRPSASDDLTVSRVHAGESIANDRHQTPPWWQVKWWKKAGYGMRGGKRPSTNSISLGLTMAMHSVLFM
ncbi:hypothetical protein CAL20_16605 [Bordetella genomosp. 4]|uniref:Uncharacterized protein n=1 Tax=Bordetella genomosp. 4 TaxID=463044 RepID=A0A261TYR8_9BORD|nr:hypothetical protein CAL20_16605 [Bordetella genomosp. 4]